MKTTSFPKNSLRAAAALLMAIMIAAGFTACTKDDNPADAFRPEMVVGKWYYEFNQHGTFGEGDAAFEFDKIIIYGNLNADRTGSWYAIFFDSFGNLIDPGNLFFGSGFQYTTSADGGVNVQLNSESVLNQLMPSWDMYYNGGQLNSIDTYTGTYIVLSPINAEQDVLVQMCLRELGMGYDGDQNVVDVSLLTADYVAQNGDVLTGSLKADVVISVADGATITLKGCYIQEKTYQHPVITCLGSAEIITSGSNILSGGPGYPSIYVPEGSTLTLSGFGNLHVYGGDSDNSDIGGSAAIGGGSADGYQNCGNIVIKSGTVRAEGKAQCAAIGSSKGGNCGNITIDGGSVYATGGKNGAGIGGGFQGKCKKINLNGGKIEATGGENYPAIGGGTEDECFCGNIKIYGGNISCYAGKNCKYALGFGTEKTNEKFEVTIYPYIQRFFMRAEDQNAKTVHDLINCVAPIFDDVELVTLMDYLKFLNTSLDDHVDEVKHGVRYIVGYQAACIIPQADIKIVKD